MNNVAAAGEFDRVAIGTATSVKDVRIRRDAAVDQPRSNEGTFLGTGRSMRRSNADAYSV